MQCHEIPRNAAPALVPSLAFPCHRHFHPSSPIPLLPSKSPSLGSPQTKWTPMRKSPCAARRFFFFYPVRTAGRQVVTSQRGRAARRTPRAPGGPRTRIRARRALAPRSRSVTRGRRPAGPCFASGSGPGSGLVGSGCPQCRGSYQCPYPSCQPPRCCQCRCRRH